MQSRGTFKRGAVVHPWKARNMVERLFFGRLGATNYRASIKEDPCSYCNTIAWERTLDHIQSASAGGAHGWHNLTPCCRPCQASKGPGSVLSLYAARGILAGRVVNNGRVTPKELTLPMRFWAPWVVESGEIVHAE